MKEKKKNEELREEGITPETADAPATPMEDECARLKSQIDEWQEKYLRTLADAENTKRRAELDAKSAIDWNTARFATDMLPFADTLSIALQSMAGKLDKSVEDGLNSVIEQFQAALAKNGVVKIKTVGEKLNPAEHRAVVSVKDDKLADGTVSAELQAGYKIGDKVIREAMVSVVKND